MLPHLPPRPLGLPLSWPWEASFAEALLRWAAHPWWAPGLGSVTYVELAPDFEMRTGRVAPRHQLKGNILPLRSRGRVLKLALGKLEKHLQSGTVLEGGFWCMGHTERPYFLRPQEMIHHVSPGRSTARRCGHGDLCARVAGGRTTSCWSTFRGTQCGPAEAVQVPAAAPQVARMTGSCTGASQGAAQPKRVLCRLHRAPPCWVCGQRGAEFCCMQGREGHRMQAL